MFLLTDRKSCIQQKLESASEWVYKISSKIIRSSQ
uniref:Uncharacterized protein n=1 Tax=Arundo donax TaxID=35708 RepID=A0A0A9HHL3_ARUDO